MFHTAVLEQPFLLYSYRSCSERHTGLNISTFQINQYVQDGKEGLYDQDGYQQALQDGIGRKSAKVRVLYNLYHLPRQIGILESIRLRSCKY